MCFSTNTLILACILFCFQDVESDYFEGVVEYKSFTKNHEGNFVPSRSGSKLKNHYKGTFYKVAYLGNKLFDDASTMEIIVNTADTSYYVVKHQEKVAKSIGIEGDFEDYIPYKVSLIHQNDTLLGYHCKKYEFVQLEYFTQKETVNHLWVSEKLKVANLPLLAKIFGYRNSVIKDGSLKGVVLKFESIEPDGSVRSRMEATNVEPMELDQSIFAVPTMYQREEYER